MKKTAVVLLGILLTLSLNANAGFKSSGYKSSGYKSSRSSAYSRPSVSSTTTKSGYQVNSSAGKNSSAVTTASRAPVSTMNGKKLTDNKGKIRTSENKPADTRPDYSNMQPQNVNRQNAGRAFAGASSTRPDSLLNGNHQPSAQIQNTIRQKESGGFGLTHLAILYLLMSDNSHSMSDSDRAWVERKIEEEKQNNDIAESPDKPDEFKNFPETDNGVTDSASLAESAESAEKSTSLYLDIARILFIVFAFAYVLYKLVQAATGSITWHSALISSALTSMAGLMVFYLNGILNVLF